MPHTYLLEIGVEEMPALMVTPSINQLVEKLEQVLQENNLEYGKIIPFSTPRRLAVRIEKLSSHQPDSLQDIKGPSKKIALDQNGNWTKAVLGFLKGQQAKVEDIVFRDLKGTEYVYLTKNVKGQSAELILQKHIPLLIESLNFSTMMRWGTLKFKFVRPIRRIVSMIDDKQLALNPISTLPNDLFNVNNNVSQGHRFLKFTGSDRNKEVLIKSANSYENDLRKAFVIVDAEERKKVIMIQLKKLAENNNWNIEIDDALLEEVNNLVEWPTVFSGSFDAKYLKIPEEVLITSMRKHQRFFHVLDQNKKLLPYFISVRNGNEVGIENVVKGNEKVLTARLEDAQFFFEEDQKQSIDFYVNKLSKLTFYQNLGTMTDKMKRVSIIAKIIANELGLDEHQRNKLKRLTGIYKFDLVTSMVGEFSDLQGIMGEKYALIKGEDPDIAVAISEHYLPNSSEGALPKTILGSILAISDRLDSLHGFFSIKMIPTGSNDPYGLRRQTLGVIRILMNHNWNLSMLDLKNKIQSEFENNGINININQEYPQLDQFFKDRLRQILDNGGVSYDVIDTVLGGTTDKLLSIIEKANYLNKKHHENNLKDSVESLTRVQRLAVKNDATNYNVDVKLFENESENKLHKSIEKLSDMNKSNLLDDLLKMTKVINNYFDNTMVMSDKSDVKQNRLNELSILNDYILKIGDFNKLVIK